MERINCSVLVIFLLISLVFSADFSFSASTEKSILQSYDGVQIYNSAIAQLKKNNEKEAIKLLSKIGEIYPFSPIGQRAQMMISFLHYLKKDYIESAIAAEYYVGQYQEGKDIEYMYYMAGVTNFAQVKGPKNTIEQAFKAQGYFTEIIQRFPNSRYVPAAKEKLEQIQEIIAAKNLSIAVFYLKNMQYHSAINRLQRVTENFSETKFYPEALFRLSEGYNALGLKLQAKIALDTLKKKFPNSEWAVMGA